MGYETSAPRSLPREEIRPGWRAAVLAYRRELRAAREDRFAWPAAYAAFREVLQEMPEEQVKMETTHAIAYAAANHTKWFWGGVYG
jgi:hypothetical protein